MQLKSAFYFLFLQNVRIKLIIVSNTHWQGLVLPLPHLHSVKVVWVPWPPTNSATPRKKRKNRHVSFCLHFSTLGHAYVFFTGFFCRRYKVYNNPVFRGIVYFCAWLLLCLAFFEDPAVPGMGLPYWVSQDIY